MAINLIPHFLIVVAVFLGPTAAALPASPPLALAADAITLEGELGPFRKTITAEQVEEGLQLVTVRLEADAAATLEPLTLKLDFPSVDINGYWSSQQTLDHVNYYRSGFTSGASSAAPLLSYYSNRLENRITVAASDALNPIKFSCYLKEEDVRFYLSLELFTVKTAPRKDYSITLRVDTRATPYHRVLDDARRWWEAMPEYRPATVPEVARRPMYSTWYSYHQNLEADQLVRECRLARELGCHAVIVDDGWQTKDSNRGYAYTGDWRPERLTEMRDFVDRVHAEDLQVVLWYSLPFMGEEADNYERFEGKYLYHWAGQRTYVLDPRYPEVREYLLETYERALVDWNLDGFKLDFIGWFKAYGDTELTAEDGRDFASVAQATDHLMTQITERLTAIRPTVLLEFRQPYVGPIMRKYGNMFRGVDCPNNAAANRNEIANLRLLSGPTAVHSDMFIWRDEEPTPAAALQLLNILFSVPQLSVRLEEISPEHRTMVAHWLGYWNANRGVLLDGEFLPGNPGANYPSLTGIADGKQITALYETPLARVERPGLQTIDLVNATGGEVVYLDLTEDFSPTGDDCLVTVFDAAGEEVSQTQTHLAAGVHRFSAPRSGLVRIEAP